MVVLPGVLDPAVFFSSEVLVDAIRGLDPRGRSLLDLGSGTGIGAIAAAEAGAAPVVAVDLDPVAIDCARRNVADHRLDDVVHVRQGDLFQPVAGERFEVVAFNPPYLQLRPDQAARAASVGLTRALEAPPTCRPIRIRGGRSPHAGRLVAADPVDHRRRCRLLDPLRQRGFAVSDGPRSRPWFGALDGVSSPPERLAVHLSRHERIQGDGYPVGDRTTPRPRRAPAVRRDPAAGDGPPHAGLREWHRLAAPAAQGR